MFIFCARYAILLQRSLVFESLTDDSDGAGLFYTSVKENKNCDLLMKYIVHRIYGFPFMQQAYVVERDAVFV